MGSINIDYTWPLPVTMTSFNANCEDDAVRVNWTTATEQNASHFKLERSRDGYIWDEVGTIAAAGTTSVPQSYELIDLIGFNSLGYYRLNQFDFDGAQETFGPISVNCVNTENEVIIYPNPTMNDFSVLVKSKEDLSGDNTHILLYDLSGKEVYREFVEILSGTNSIMINQLNLASGCYIVTIESSTERLFTPVKLVVQ